MAFNLVGKFNKINVTAATMALAKRGPDFQDIHIDEWVGIGHRRLSIIDTSEGGNQPMWDESKRYCIVFNGEIFNYRELKADLQSKGVSFHSASDTEVLLNLYIREGEQCLSRLNGFFAFCIYDKAEQTFFLARDRYGIKPLLYLFDEDKFIFGSEMKSLIEYGIDRSIDYSSVLSYLQLNYIPAPNSIFRNVKKLMPGHWMKLDKGELKIDRYYSIPYNRHQQNNISYDDAKGELKRLMKDSVERRLIADVPLGAFLSGGIDSSVTTAIASELKPDLHTFSIGFRDEKFFDETSYANLVAKKFNTRHTVFSLTNDDLYQHVSGILDYIDEPFADSSAIAVYILSKETRKHAIVALSGDGADELLSGYNKHAAFYKSLNPGPLDKVANTFAPLLTWLPQSRNNPVGNKVRQLKRFEEGMKLTPAERYWRWASFASLGAARKLLHPDTINNEVELEYDRRKKEILQPLAGEIGMNDVLFTDMTLVLPNDMLTKVDLMSMANALEVRVPFLDFEVVNFVFSLPDHYKIDKSMRKRILQDAYRDILPPELYNRPKKGFEVPLLKWLRKEMKSLITDDLLSEDFIKHQRIFNYAEIAQLKKRLFSSNPGDIHAQIWGMLVFQWWWRKWSSRSGMNS